jgi:hypothetical protein
LKFNFGEQPFGKMVAQILINISMKYTLLLTFLCFFGLLQAQDVGQKVSPNLHTILSQRSSHEQLFTLVVADVAGFQAFLQRENIAANIIQIYLPAQIVIVKTTLSILRTHLLPDRQLLFADISERQPQEELSVSGLDLSLNKVNLAHHLFPTTNGAGLTVSIKEERFDVTDIDFLGRYQASPSASSRTATHASIMATILGGGGNSFYNGKGAAWGATLTSANFSNLLPENDYKALNISVQNHSYGVGIENYYGAEAVAYDASVVEQPELLHVFSAGNRGNQASETGIYKGLTNVANLTGAFKMAKNVLTVGSLDLTGNVPLLSSKGPAYDGRVKPELVALGQDGSSGAAALTSGVGLLLQQAFLEEYSEKADASLVKAILINSADDVGAPGLDFQSGYGSVNAWRALETIKERRIQSGMVKSGEVEHIPITVPENARNLKITLVWSDTPAAANAEQALENDLDLELRKEDEIWLPWVLNVAPHLDSLNLPSVRKKDHINNVEQITVENPTAGSYDIFVNSFQSSTSAQIFNLAYQWDTMESFQWTFPTRDDAIEAGQALYVRWETTFDTPIARLEYALDGGDWQLLADSVQLSNNYYVWQTPQTFATTVLRLIVGDQVFVSDTFIIAPPIKLEVGFNCEDQFLLYWDNMPGADAYQLYRLGKSYLEPLQMTTDTFVLFDKPQNPALWYAIAPVNTANQLGIKSYATNYTIQGVDCYFKNFITDLVDGKTAHLRLAIGTTFHLKNITFEKAAQGVFSTLQSFAITNQLDWEAFDSNLTPGINTYRAKIELQNGAIIYSDPSSVYYSGADGYWLFPNPVQRGQALQLLSNTFEEQEVRIFDALGREIQRQPLTSEIETIITNNLSTGIYRVVIFKNDQWLRQFKLLFIN